MTESARSAPAAQGAPTPQQPTQVDIKRLADKVYRLMLADLRRERGRGAAEQKR